VLDILTERATALGVDIRFDANVPGATELADADVVVACDGVLSVRTALAGSGDIIPEPATDPLHIRLDPLPAPRHTAAIDELCQLLNDTLLVIDDVAVVVATVQAPPEALGVTHWSARLLGKHLGISFASVARIWREWNLQPWRRETFKFSTDPELDAKVRDVVGLYLNPPDKAVVVCIDEKSQIQALDRTAPILPIRPGLPEKATHDYVRHGTTTLFAALEVATGKVTDACHPRHTHAEFLAFLKQVAKAYPRVPLHVVADNYATHKHPAVQAWLAKHPRVRMHFTPTSGSWLNLVEVFFGIITRQAIRRGTFTSVKDLIAAIETFIEPGTTAANRSCGPRPPTKSSPKPTVKSLQTRDTSWRSRSTHYRCSGCASSCR
jgi:transposase